MRSQQASLTDHSNAVRTLIGRQIALVMAIMLICFGSATVSASAQHAIEQSQAEKARRFLELADDPDVRSWLLSAKSGSDLGPTQTAPPESSFSYSAFSVGLRAHMANLVTGLQSFPEEAALATARLQQELDTSQSARPVVFVVAFVAAGLVVQWFFWRASTSWRRTLAVTRRVTTREKLSGLLSRLLLAICLVLAYALGSLGFFLLFDWPPLVREIVVGYLFAAVMFRLAAAVFEFLLAPSGSRTVVDTQRFRILPIADRAAQFWSKRLGYAVGWFAFGSVTVHLLTTLGFSDPSRQVAAYALGTILLAMGAEAVWNRPLSVSDRAESVNRLGAHARNWLWTFYFAALWLMWVA